jgi:PDZ domain-containing protein
VKRRTWIAAAALIVLMSVAAFVRLPYWAIGPGPAREVEPLITVQGHPTYTSSGKLIMTTVSYYQVTPIQAVAAWIDPNFALVKRDVLFQQGTTQEQEHQRSLSEMDQSKIDAASVVLSQLTPYPKEHGTGVLIEGIVPNCPAEGHLFAGDLVTSIDGEPTPTRQAALRVFDSTPVSEPLTFHVSAGGQQADVTLSRKTCVSDDKRPLVGVVMIDQFPFDVSISSGDIGGPSAGLMWSLGLYDLLTPGDLTGGRTIAGTGTIDQEGNVGPIGGIADKVVAAERVGATIFLAPQDNMAELKGVDTGDMKIVSVSSFKDALQYLQQT